MKKFLVLYRTPISATAQMAQATPEQAKAGMQAWMRWAKESDRAIVDLGAPLGDPLVVGPGTPDREHIGGFSILQCERCLMAMAESGAPC